MRLRLLAAVQALLADPSLSGVPDAARLSAVVLYAKSRAPQGRSDDNQTSIWGAELGRWLGMSESTVHHAVLPTLRRSGAVRTRVVTDAAGQPTGLDCLVMPLWRARRAGGVTHPLALSKVELATLLRLLEVLFGPGWSPKDKPPVAAGLLAGRTGRGAATDRLGLLLMVLSTNSRGWLQLCPGAVDTSRGRPAATVARLLGCSPAAGAKVLARLREQGAVQVERRETGSGLRARSRVRLVLVARAHGHAVREARQAVASVFSGLAATAFGDLETAEGAVTGVTAGVRGAVESENAELPDLAAAAELHASHASVDSPASFPAVDLGFSGEGRGKSCGRPERAGAREDQAAPGNAGARLTLVGGASGPLRGEQPKKSSAINGRKSGEQSGSAGQALPVGSLSQGSQQRGRAPLPSVDLRAVLAPVQLLWARLGRSSTRRMIESAVRVELATMAGLVGHADAGEALSERLTRRLAADGGPAAVRDPVGWLVGRGLPQRRFCGDVRCDESMRLDTGGQCATCEYLVADRRARRHQVAAAVDAQMPHASEAERRAETERRLHEGVTAEGWAKQRRREQLEAERAGRRATAQARAEAEADVEPVPTVEPPATVVLPAPRPMPDAPQPKDERQAALVLEELTREQVIDWRARAQRCHQVVLDHIDQHGELSARRLFTNAFVDQVLRLASTSHLVLAHTTWEPWRACSTAI